MKIVFSIKKEFIKSLIIWFSIISTCSLIFCCDLTHSDQDMYFVKYSLKKVSLKGNPIKTSGYFYREHKRYKPISFDFFRFNRDGSFHFVWYEMSLEDCDRFYLNWPYMDNKIESKFNIGIFNIKNETIWTEIHERYYTGSTQPTYFRIGQVLNDTTIRLFKYCLPNGKDSVYLDDTLHFRSEEAIRAETSP
jgi:hypothetical protein